MKTALNLPDRRLFAAVAKPTLHLAVAFADELTHRIAKGVCSRIVRRVHRAFDVHAFWWSFESLDERDTLERAATVAARADLIFCAVYVHEDLPGSVKSWAERWLARTGQNDGALVALLKTTRPIDASPLAAEIHLSALARAARMDYFVKVFDQPERATRERLIAGDDCHAMKSTCGFP